MVTYMMVRVKKRVGILAGIILLTAAFLAAFWYGKDYSHAADEIFITYNGQQLNPEDTLQMTSGSLPLLLKTTGTAYDEDRYVVEWSFSDSTASMFATIEQSPTNKMLATVRAVSPGLVTVVATVKDSMEGNAVLGSTTCNINIMFAIDTSLDANLYRFVNDSDTERSLIMYADDSPVQLNLNFGDATDAQWISSNDEVVTVGKNTGILTPVGAGRTQVTATYTPEGESVTYTAILNVYIKPKVSLVNGSGYTNSLVNQKIPSGTSIYTDTVFTNNIQAIRNKIVWVVKKDDGRGNPEVLADSLGKESDIIHVTPAGMYENELKIEGTAGKYVIEFYTNGTYTSESNHTSAYDPTVMTFTLTAEIGDKEETLGAGDSYNLAEAFGMTQEDFLKYFVSNNWTKDGGSIYNYATYDNTTSILTIKNNVSEGTLIDTVNVKPTYKKQVAELLGLNAEDEDVLASMPMSFKVTITLKDQLRLNRTELTLSEKEEFLLVAHYNGAYDGNVKFESSDESYVKVDDNGLVTAIKNTKGDVKITASLTNSSGKTITAECLVVVEAALNSFTLDPNVTEMSMFVGESTTIKAVIKQAIKNPPLSWTCSTVNSKIFTVQASDDRKSAVITAVGTGTADLEVTNTVNPDDKKTIRITVRSSIQTISLKQTEMSVPRYKDGYNMGKNDVSYTPTNATDTELIWTSSNPTIATVDEDGYISFINAGVTLITVRPVNNPNGVMASCLLTIIGSADKVILSEKELTMNVGEIKGIEVDFEPINTTADLTWTPTGETKDCVTILPYDEERRIASFQAKSPGVVYINITSPQTGTETLKITVKQPSTALNITPKDVIIRTGDTTSLKASLTPANSTDNIVWKSYNNAVAKVDEEGRVTGVKSGITFVQATAYNGKIAGPTAVIQITVQDGVKSVTLDSAEKTVRVGSAITIAPIFTPVTAFDKAMSWKASNGNVKLEASGVSNVKVTGVKTGTALVTGTTADGGFSVSCLITVLPQITESDTKVTVSPKSKYLAKGKSFYVTATVTGTSNKKVKWSSSKKSVATVTSGGKVKAKKIGTAYIKATAQDGSGAYARCKVRVVRKVKKVKLNKYSGRLLVGSTMKLKATVTPKNATIKSVKWTTNKKSVATVSSSGRVLGVGEGIVKIKATAKDGSGKSATCIIRVSEPVEATGITVANSEITVAKGKTAQSGIALNPVNSTTKIKYHSDNPKVATVNQYGKITTKRAGQATIYGTTSTGLYGYCDVLVVDLNRKAVTMRQYDTEQLRVNEISTGVTWYSRDINIATVSSTGLVTGRKKGTTTIYAVVHGVKLGCRVTVKNIK